MGPAAWMRLIAASSSAWSAVKSWSTVARSLNWMTSAASSGRRVLTNRVAAAWAVASFSSMEAEASISTAIEMGRFSWVKSDSSWRMPSSNTAKSLEVRSVT